MRECKVCGSTSKVVFHHLSYQPEFGLDVCRKCHFVLHCVPLEVIPQLVELKKQYGHLWVNGNAQYQKSRHYRQLQYMLKKTDKYKAKDKERRQDPEWKAKRQAYLDNNKEKLSIRKKIFYLAHRDKRLLQMREYGYKRRHPDTVQESALDAS